MAKKYDIPDIVIKTSKTLLDAGFEAFLVGGCVRDLLLHVKPKDWDITTNARPEEIQKLFFKTVYENKFGTVAVINETIKDETLKIIEITPYRLESKYSDKRHPDKVIFTTKLENDLKRRDFTINALALDIVSHETIDFFEGQKDLKNKTIRTVGNPGERFNEDALRILRAIRLAVELGFSINQETKEAIKKQAHLLEMISKERIRDEFVKIIMSDRPKDGIEIITELGVLDFVIPELKQTFGIEQNKAHKFNVWEHSLFSLKHAADKKMSLEVRLASFLHDIGKPISRRWNKDKKDWTFYGHEIIGAKMAVRILSRLRFSKKTIETAVKLVRYHLFFSDTEKITLSAVRRTVRNVGLENVWELMNVRFCDRIGMGRPKETPYRLRKYEAMIEEAMRAPLSVGMLKINGNDIMKLLNINPGPKVGHILHILLEEVLDDPKKNTQKWLEKRIKEIGSLSEEELIKLGERAMGAKNQAEGAEIEKIRKKWWVE